MKKNFWITLFFCLIYTTTYTQEEEREITLEAGYVGDFLYNFDGGIKTGFTYMGVIDLGLGFETEKARLWKGGEFYLHLENTHGGSGSGSFIGDMQIASNIDNGNYTYLYELWYKQGMGPVTIQAGVMDMNAEYYGSENAGNFINSSFGIQPTASLNNPVPIFPINSLGLHVRYDVNDAIGIQAGIWDGDPGDLEDDLYNLDYTMSEDEGFQIVSEIHYTDENLGGTYKLGGYYHTADFEDFSDTGKVVSGNYEVHVIADQLLFSEGEDQGLGSFVQLGWTPSKQNMNTLYIGYGLIYTGLLPGRDSDITGLAMGYAGIGKDFRDANPGSKKHETVIELTYNATFGDNIFIQPDFQYIINPGIGDLDNALVGILRFGINF
ncbi:MAG: carbohydrate porin [Bacteroidales bacterium]|nr:carbohydrate porin [Bacteroidales bacterium]